MTDDEMKWVDYMTGAIFMVMLLLVFYSGWLLGVSIVVDSCKNYDQFKRNGVVVTCMVVEVEK